MATALTTADAAVVYSRDPGDVRPYTFDWSAVLAGDTISEFTATNSSGVVVDSMTFTSTQSTVWISGGRAGNVDTVQHSITTAAGQTINLSMVFRTMNK